MRVENSALYEALVNKTAASSAITLLPTSVFYHYPDDFCCIVALRRQQHRFNFAEEVVTGEN